VFQVFPLFFVCAVLFPGVVNLSFSEVGFSLFHANVQPTAEMDLSLRPLSRGLMSVFRKTDDTSCMFCEQTLIITFSEIHKTTSSLTPCQLNYHVLSYMSPSISPFASQASSILKRDIK
jgi:hypothetical protein